MPGHCLHKKRAADAALDQAGAQYRGAVILACQNVADTLRALQADADALKASAEADRAAKGPLISRNASASSGRSAWSRCSMPSKPISKRNWHWSRPRPTVISDTAGLFQALGGGWWNRTEEPHYEQFGTARE